MADSNESTDKKVFSEWVKLYTAKCDQWKLVACDILSVNGKLKMHLIKEEQVMLDNFLKKETVMLDLKDLPGWAFSVIGREETFKIVFVDKTPSANKFMESFCSSKQKPLVARPSLHSTATNKSIKEDDPSRKGPRAKNRPSKKSLPGCSFCGEAFLAKKKKRDRETQKMVHLGCWTARNCHFCGFSWNKFCSMDCSCGFKVHTSCLKDATEQAGGLYIHKEKINAKKEEVVVGDVRRGQTYRVVV